MCRLVYELAQARHGAAHRFQSLDDNYFVATERLVYERVIHDHIPIRPNEINVKQGDVVKFLRNNWDGYVKVTNPKKNRLGLYLHLKSIEYLKCTIILVK